MSAPLAIANAPDGRDHWPLLLHTGLIAGAGVRSGTGPTGKSDANGFDAPSKNPVHPDRHPRNRPTTPWASIRTRKVMNHLDQPRELVKGNPISRVVSNTTITKTRPRRLPTFGMTPNLHPDLSGRGIPGHGILSDLQPRQTVLQCVSL